MGMTSAGSFALQKEKVSGGRMDLNDKKKKALELMKGRRPAPAPASQPMPSEQPGAPQEDSAPPASNRFAAAIAKRRGK